MKWLCKAISKLFKGIVYKPPTEQASQDGSEVTTEPKATEEPKTERESRFLWCLDNGHGIYTQGKRSPILEDGRQLLEYSFNRDIVNRIAEQLDKIGINYFIVVPEIEVGNALEMRVKRANNEPSELPKIFVSVHANAAPTKNINDWCDENIKGIETWFYHQSQTGRKIANIFQRHLIEQTGFKDRKLKSRPEEQFYALRKTGMPAILTENGFYNNLGECKELLNEEVRDKIAWAHVLAILEIEEKGITFKN